MKRDQIKKLLGESATDEIIDAIMKLHGESVQANQTQITDLTKQLETANGQITEANKQIEGFKNMKPEELQKAADDYKAKWEQAQADAKSQLAALKFDHALDGALTTAKARNPKAVRALLQTDLLKLADDGTVSGLKEQLEKIQADNDYLFNSEEPTPKIVAGGNNQPVITDAFEAALLRGAGIEAPKK
jgi:DNA repair exonuclease SbcCD ATPase subunit